MSMVGDRREAWEEAKDLRTRIGTVLDSVELSLSIREELDFLIDSFGDERWRQGTDDEQENQGWQE